MIHELSAFVFFLETRLRFPWFIVEKGRFIGKFKICREKKSYDKIFSHFIGSRSDDEMTFPGNFTLGFSFVVVVFQKVGKLLVTFIWGNFLFALGCGKECVKEITSQNCSFWVNLLESAKIFFTAFYVCRLMKIEFSTWSRAEVVEWYGRMTLNL